MADLEPVYRQFGARLRQIRKSLGITQDELAKRHGALERTSVCNIEIGRQRVLLDDVLRFATALHVAPSRLLEGSVLTAGSDALYSPQPAHQEIEAIKRDMTNFTVSIARDARAAKELLRRVGAIGTKRRSRDRG